MKTPYLRPTDSDRSFKTAKKKAYKLLSRRDHTPFEIAEKLREKQFSEATISETIAYLKEIDLLDESRFIRHWSRFRLEQHSYGPIRLRQELLSKGLPTLEVDCFIETFSGEWDPARLAEQAFLRRYKNPTVLSSPILRRRAFDYLQRKGHTTESILTVFKKNGLQ